MTPLTIGLCFKPKNDDGKKNPLGERLESFAKASIDRWRSEIERKGEPAGSPAAEWTIDSQDKNAFLLVGTPGPLCGALGEGLRRCVAVLPDDRWDKALNELLQDHRADVLLVVRGAETVREEDVLQLSEILKRLARERLRASAEAGEEKLAKHIDWKCKMDDSGVPDNSFISFFSDPAMAQMGRELKAALTDVDRASREKGEKKAAARRLTKVHSILLLGETGTGKSLAAQWIARRLFPTGWETKPPFFPVNVGTLPKNMVDIELFGSKKAAFTDAEDKKGILEEHAGKVIFLDEIGEMEPESQVRLLKYLDSGEVRPVGSNRVFRAFSVIVAATNRPLAQWAARQDSPFRPDLYYRFEHVVKIPSLKERRKDMRLLISLLLQDPQVNARKDDGPRTIEKISLEAIEYLENAEYPGNFRELRARIRAAVGRAASEGASTLCLRHLAHP
jgi:transcriptional regulator of acetoin/glycerol metabolism